MDEPVLISRLSGLVNEEICNGCLLVQKADLVFDIALFRRGGEREGGADPYYE